MNLTIFLSSYLLILSSIIGYGLILQKVIIKNINLEFEFVLLGYNFIFNSYFIFLHFFTSHNYFHNTVILIVESFSF